MSIAEGPVSQFGRMRQRPHEVCAQLHMYSVTYDPPVFHVIQYRPFIIYVLYVLQYGSFALCVPTCTPYTSTLLTHICSP